MYLKESSGSIVAQNLQAFQYTTVAGTCTVTSAVRDPSVLTVGATGASYTIVFKCPTRVSASGRFQLVFPEEQLSYSSSTTCSNGNSVDASCTWSTGTNSNGMSTTIATFLANPFCTTSSSTDCAASTTFTLKLANAKNPNYINSPLTNSIEIYTQNQISSTWLTVDQVTSGVYFTNTCTPGTLTSTSLTRGGSALTGGIASYTITFTTATVLPKNSVAVVSFPSATIYSGTNSVSCTRGGASVTCSSTTNSVDTTQIDSVTVSSACTSTTCAASTSITIVITNVYNPFSTKPNTNVTFVVQTKTSASNGLVDQATLTGTALSLSPNTLTSSLLAPTSPIIVGDSTAYTIQMTNQNNKLPKSSDGGSLVVTLPSELKLLSTTCSAQFGSTTLTCSASTSTQKVTVTSSSELARNSVFSVTMASVRNAQTGAPSSAFTLATFYGTFAIDS